MAQPKLTQTKTAQPETLFAEGQQPPPEQASAPAGRKPFDKIRVSGGIQIVFWEREIQRGEQKILTLQPSISNSWRDKSGEWQNRTINMGSMAHLYELYATAGKVHEIHQRFKSNLRTGAASEVDDSDAEV